MMDTDKIVRPNIILECLSGSRAYGTSHSGSDIDLRGIFIGTPESIVSPFFYIEQMESKDEDRVIYELSKFMTLIIKQNPNIIELLWTDKSDIKKATPAYWELRSCRDALLSSKAKYTFSGYAMDQLKRIKGHNKWINSPQPKEPPRQVDYVSLVQNFQGSKMLKLDMKEFRDNWRLVGYGGDIFGLYEAKGYRTYNERYILNMRFDGDRCKLGLPELIVKFNKQEYKRDKVRWKQYWSWKKNRNVARSELEERYGYDTKDASHLIRILRMGVEILEEGVVKVKRPDAAELVGIRNGLYSYDELLEKAGELEERLDALYEDTSLPENVDIQHAAEIALRAYETHWNCKLPRSDDLVEQIQGDLINEPFR